MATDYSPQLQMKDIYDLAQKVGEQFHHLLSQFGNTYLAEHISTVVKALEYLETTFEENQRLQVKNGKLMLDNDNLAREIRELSTTVKELRDVQEKYVKEQREKQALTLKVESLQTRNYELVGKMEVMRNLMQTPHAATPELATVEEIDHPLKDTEVIPSSIPHLSNGTLSPLTKDSTNLDALEVPRINRRLHMVETELQQTQANLSMLKKYNQELSDENNALKLQIEEYRAEVALQSLEISKEFRHTRRDSKQDEPRYYKQDLLAVLRERNELKEELDNIKEELGMTKVELKKLQVHSPTQPATHRFRVSTLRKPRSQTRVREILDSFTNDIVPSDSTNIPMAALNNMQ